MGDSVEHEDKPLVPYIDMNEPEEDDELLEWAKENIGENSEKTVQIIEELKDMIYERGEVQPHRTDDAFLLRFLRARRFIVRMAHRLLVNYYNFKEASPEFFNVDLKRLIELAYHQVISVPPYLDQSGRRIVIFRMGQWDTSKFKTDELFQTVILLTEVALLEPKFQIMGGQCIFDLSDLSVGQAWYMSPTIARQMLQVGFAAMPIRIHSIHIIHHSWVFDIAYSVLKPLLGDFMTERIHFHNDYESLHEHIDPKHLPERYGGVHRDYSFNTWIESIGDNEAVLREIESMGYANCREVVKNFKMREEI